MSLNKEVIDLTDSFTLAAHRSMADIIIELDDSLDCFTIASSYNNTTDCNSTTRTKTRKSGTGLEKKKTSTPKNKDSSTSKSKLDNKRISCSNKWGECPICWDVLGKNPLASTKCGHVYCMRCLEHSLSVEKKCPTCRRVLKGSSAYHPLYIS